MTKRKNLFHGKGPFSTINKVTTHIRMIEAVHKYGIGGDAVKTSIPIGEFEEGVLHPEKYLARR